MYLITIPKQVKFRNNDDDNDISSINDNNDHNDNDNNYNNDSCKYSECFLVMQYIITFGYIVMIKDPNIDHLGTPELVGIFPKGIPLTTFYILRFDRWFFINEWTLPLIP